MHWHFDSMIDMCKVDRSEDQFETMIEVNVEKNWHFRSDERDLLNYTIAKCTNEIEISMKIINLLFSFD